MYMSKKEHILSNSKLISSINSSVILEVNLDEVGINIIGSNFKFYTLSSWRIRNEEGILCSNHFETEQAKIMISKVINEALIINDCDLAFYFSNNFVFEVFSIFSYDAWYLAAPDLIYVG